MTMAVMIKKMEWVLINSVIIVVYSNISLGNTITLI